MQYVIAQPPGLSRPLLLRIRKDGKGVVPDHTLYSDPVSYEFSAKDVVVPLGENPPYGTAYGVLVEPVVERWAVRSYGNVFCYVDKIPQATRSRIENALLQGVRRIRRLSPQLDLNDLITEIRNPRGLQEGLYKYRPKGPDVLIIRHHEGQGLRELTKVVSHELAHRVWLRLMTPEQRSEWIKVYARFVSVRTVSVADIRTMVRSMLQMSSIRDFLKECAPEEHAGAAMYLGWLTRVRGISQREAQDLISAGSSLPVPDTHIHRSDRAAPITMYAKESATEMFAEAVSSWCVSALENDVISRLVDSLRREMNQR